MGILSLLILIPLFGAALLFLFPNTPEKIAKGVAFGVAGITLLASLTLLTKFENNSFHFQAVERHDWIPSLGISCSLGVDGISLWLIILAAFMVLIAIGMSRRIDKNVHAYMALLLLLESFMIGAFSSLDLILFFVFFELTLFPFYFLITQWGGERRAYAGAKFFIYTFAGSIFMLIGMIATAFQAGHLSFDLVHLQSLAANGNLWHGNTTLEALVFWAFAIALLIKAPSFPFHSWIPDTYGESPTVVPVLSSVLVKLGSFGLLRFCLPLFPDVIANQVPILMGLAVAGILYGAVLAILQPDARRLIAYSSLSHMGFIVLGIFSLTYSGMVGASFQQLSHAIISGGLVALLAFLYDRNQSLQIGDYGGLKRNMPLFAALFLILMLASLGLPGTNGFIGEFLALMGTFEASVHNLFGLNWAYPVLAGLGVVLGAAYLLNLFQKLFYGVPSEISKKLQDLSRWEVAVVALPIALVIWGGLYPSTFLNPMQASLQATRLMATSPQGQRPTWEDETQAIDMRTGSLLSGTTVLAAGNLHYQFPPRYLEMKNR
jgi:NADH-quinone oxidoreductase subunit M